MEVVEMTKQFSPSLFLVYTENNNKESSPILFPLNINLIADNARIDDVLDSIVKIFSSDKFTLEMILYAMAGENEKSGESAVMFGARDTGGNTVHTLYGQKETSINVDLEKKEVESTLFHVWLPPAQKNKVTLQLLLKSIFLQVVLFLIKLQIHKYFLCLLFYKQGIYKFLSKEFV